MSPDFVRPDGTQVDFKTMADRRLHANLRKRLDRTAGDQRKAYKAAIYRLVERSLG